MIIALTMTIDWKTNSQMGMKETIENRQSKWKIKETSMHSKILIQSKDADDDNSDDANDAMITDFFSIKDFSNYLKK